MPASDTEVEPAPVGYDAIQVTFALDPDDWVRIALAASGLTWRRTAVMVGALCVVPTLLFFALAEGELTALSVFVTLFPLVVVAIFLVAFTALRRRRVAAHLRHAVTVDRAQYPLGPQRIGIGPAGIRHESGDTRSLTAWSFVERVVVDRTHIVLRSGPTSGWTIPARAFPTDEARQRFVEAARRWQAQPSPAEPATAADPGEGYGDFALSFALTVADYEAVVRWATREATRVRPVQVLLVAIAALLAITSCATPEIGAMGRGMSALFLLGALVGLPALWAQWLVPWSVRRMRRRFPARFPMREQHVHLGPAGILQITENGRYEESWGRVQRIVEDAEHFYVYNGPGTAFLVPKRAFASPDEAERFHARAREWQEGASRLPARKPAPLRDPATASADPFAPPE